MAGRWELTEEQWMLVEPVLRPARRADNRGRPWHETRAVLNGVFWVLGTGAQWRELPEKYPSVPDLSSTVSTVDSQRQARRGLAAAGAIALCARQAQPGRSVRRCHLRERQKGGFAVGPTRRGKGTKIVAVAAGNSLPLAVSVASASPAECKLVEEVLAGSFLDELPVRLIGDKAYDSDKLDQQLKDEYGIEMIAPNRRNRGKTQDRRKLRRYKKRWKVERLFAWMHNFRRLVTRWEFHIENFLEFAQLACIHMLLKRL